MYDHKHLKGLIFVSYLFDMQSNKCPFEGINCVNMFQR